MQCHCYVDPVNLTTNVCLYVCLYTVHVRMTTNVRARLNQASNPAKLRSRVDGRLSRPK